MKMIQKGLFRVCFQPITMLNCCTTCISWEIRSYNTQQSRHNEHTHFCRNFVAKSATWFSGNEGGGGGGRLELFRSFIRFGDAVCPLWWWWLWWWRCWWCWPGEKNFEKREVFPTLAEPRRSTLNSSKGASPPAPHLLLTKCITAVVTTVVSSNNWNKEIMRRGFPCLELHWVCCVELLELL